VEIPKPSEDHKQFFRSLVPDDPEVEIKPMFGNLGAFVHGNAIDAARRAGVDGVAVLSDPLPDLAGGNQQDPGGAVERFVEARRVVVVIAADVNAAVGQVLDLGGVPSRRGDLPGGDALLEQALDDEPAELAGGTGDDD